MKRYFPAVLGRADRDDRAKTPEKNQDLPPTDPDDLFVDSNPDVELRVTLSYFAEPNKFGRQVFHGLDLKWDMQGPQESEQEFLQRINALSRPAGVEGKRLKVTNKKSFKWDLRIQARSRGTPRVEATVASVIEV